MSPVGLANTRISTGGYAPKSPRSLLPISSKSITLPACLPSLLYIIYCLAPFPAPCHFANLAYLSHLKGAGFLRFGSCIWPKVTGVCKLLVQHNSSFLPSLKPPPALPHPNFPLPAGELTNHYRANRLVVKLDRDVFFHFA